MKIGIKKISELTGYSLATISNALNHRPGVNKDTSAHIFKIARDIGYLNSAKISKIKFITYKNTGEIIEDTPFFPEIIKGVEQEAKSFGFETVFSTLNRESQTYMDDIDNILKDETSGILLLGTEMIEEDYIHYENILDSIVILDGWSEEIDYNCVLINNIDSAYKATNYLIKNNHSIIGYLGGAFRIKNFKQRFVGFKRALDRNNIALKENHKFRLRTTMEGAYYDMKKYLEESVDLPTAFFADNDVIALGAIRALKEFGISIPKDISIIGFDNLRLGEVSSPQLTTMNVPKQEIGQLAVRRLFENIKNKSNIIYQTVINTDLVERDSVIYND